MTLNTLSANDITAGHASGRLQWPVERLEAKALHIRRDIVTLLAKAQTGHSGGPLSSADFGTALFFHELNIDPKHPDWPERDFWHFSIGHVTPVIYSLMAERGYFPLKDLMKFRAFDGHAQGHPSKHDTPGIEVSAGSLGQGLSVCCGVAMAARLDRHARRVYCVMGDGEQQEGQIWEASMFAAHYQLDNLCGIIDYNRKQIDGDVQDIMGIKPLGDKWRSFNWNVIECQGHDMADILRAFADARAHKGQPSVILAHTVMGQGVSYMADDYRWHGKPPKMDQAEEALKELGTSYGEWAARLLGELMTTDAKGTGTVEGASNDPRADASIALPEKVEMRKTREGFGRALVDLGEQDPRIVVLVGDLSESTMVHFFAEKFPDRFIQVGIAEQNMMCVAAGLAAMGKIPFLATYGAFASCRSADQMRVTVAYSNLNVKIGGAHGGISVGPDGATHQAMEEISIVRSIPNMSMVVPCDFWETYKATMAIAKHQGPVYLRFGREDVPVVTNKDTPFTFGKGEVFAEGTDLSIIACGVMVYEALRAREALAAKGVSARVVDLHTVKPLDRALIERCARETGAIVTAEEHQVNGGLGGAVAEVVVQTHVVPMELVAVHDRFGQSGKPAELMDAFGLRAKDIVAAAERVMERKRR